jgi:hypothetical protein
LSGFPNLKGLNVGHLIGVNISLLFLNWNFFLLDSFLFLHLHLYLQPQKNYKIKITIKFFAYKWKALIKAQEHPQINQLARNKI